MSTVGMGGTTVVRARLTVADVALEERDPGTAVPLGACDHPAVDRPEFTARLGHDERRSRQPEQSRPVVESVRRVGEDEIDVEALAHHQRVAGDDRAAIGEIECAEVVAQPANGGSIPLDERAVGGAPREGLDAERTAAGEQVGDGGVPHEIEAAERVEHRFSDLVGGGPRVGTRRRQYASPPKLTRHHAHGRQATASPPHHPNA
jgi:hypothetical protein